MLPFCTTSWQDFTSNCLIAFVWNWLWIVHSWSDLWQSQCVALQEKINAQLYTVLANCLVCKRASTSSPVRRQRKLELHVLWSCIAMVFIWNLCLSALITVLFFSAWWTSHYKCYPKDQFFGSYLGAAHGAKWCCHNVSIMLEALGGAQYNLCFLKRWRNSARDS